MWQNSIFRYDATKLSAPLGSSVPLRRRPGGHTLELLLYLSLSMFGIVTAIIFQWHIRLKWAELNYYIFWLLLVSPPFAVLWMAFCKLDALENIEGSEAGIPWNVIFLLVRPINGIIRRILNIGKMKTG